MKTPAFYIIIIFHCFCLDVLFADIQTIAISYFDNTSGLEEYNPLSKGLADMLITDLSNVKSIQIVEREKLESLLKEIELGESKFMDESTAQELGKGLGAGYILTGSYFIMGETMRIDARLVNVGTGEVSMGEEITGETKTFFVLEKELVQKLIVSLDIELSRTEERNIKKVQTESFDSFNAYSTALDSYDKGEYEESLTLLEKATEFDNDFDLAWDRLEDLEEKINTLVLARKMGIESKSIDIINRINNKDVTVFPDLVQVMLAMYTELTNDSPILYRDSSSTVIDNKINEFYTKIAKNINFHRYIIEIMETNGLINEKYFTMTIEELINFYYLMNVNIIRQLFTDYSDDFPQIPERIPDIVDVNNNLVIKDRDVNKIMIRVGTKMMEKYPTGMYFSTFKLYVETAINAEKNK